MNKAPTSQASTGERVEDRIVSRIYDVALDPLSYGDLLDDWEELIAPVRRRADRSEPINLPRPDLGLHFRRLADLLDQTERGETKRPEESELKPFRRVAAFCITRDLQITACNDAARDLYGLGVGAGMARMPMAAEDLEALGARVRELFKTVSGDTRLLRLHVAGEDGRSARPILFRLRRITCADCPPFVLVVTSHLRWPAGLSDALAASFGLTASETEVLRALTQSQSPKEIAEGRQRSVETVRAQIKSLQQKTETRSQGELVRLALSAMDVADPVAEAPGAQAPTVWSGGGPTLKPQRYRSLRRPDGRQVDYLVFGAAQGRSVIHMGSFLNLLRWPAVAEAEAERRGLRIIVPVRPGYLNSTPLPADQPRLDAVAHDVAAIAEAEGAERFPMIVLGQDASYAAAFNLLHPGRLRGVIGCAATLPVDDADCFDRMGKWHRFIYTSARFTPQLLPFMIRAGVAMARRTGDGDFLRTVTAESPSDQALLKDPAMLEAIMAGTEPLLQFRTTPDAIAAEFRLRSQRAGDRLLQGLQGNFPVWMLHGPDDLHTPPATLAERERQCPWVRFVRLEDGGVLLFYRHWARVLDLLTELTKK